MNKLLIALILFLSATAVAADETYTSNDKKTTIVLHTKTVGYQVSNEKGDFQVEFISTFKVKGKSVRGEMAVSCGKKGGRLAFIENDGSLSSQELWVADGPNLGDQLAQRACSIGARQAINEIDKVIAKIDKDEKAAKTSKSAI